MSIILLILAILILIPPTIALIYFLWEIFFAVLWIAYIVGIFWAANYLLGLT